MRRPLRAALGVLGLVALAATGMLAATMLQEDGAAADIADGQPIPFPHDLHAGANQIPCMYCHSSADRSVDAGIPAVQVCAGCHIPGGVPMIRADSPGVKLLAAYWERKQPIPWVRIYDLPDHVHFPHMMHVNAGVACQECHGPVETMPVVEKASSLRMGWCLECHEARKARVDCFVCHY